jgi:hypothetical protein
MSRLIEVQRVEDCPSPLRVRVGDVLVLPASGARVQAGGPAIELLGPFLPAVVGTDGEVLAPEGAPNTVLVRARQPGSATIDVFTRDPFHASRPITMTVAVEK